MTGETSNVVYAPISNSQALPWTQEWGAGKDVGGISCGLFAEIDEINHESRSSGRVFGVFDWDFGDMNLGNIC